MGDLFEDFGIELPDNILVQISPDILIKKGVSEKNIELLSNYTKWLDKLKYPESLKQNYLNKCFHLYNKTGTFFYLCAKCFKPINNYDSLVFDECTSLLYGAVCNNNIQKRLNLLQYKLVDGLVLAKSKKLKENNCVHCGRTVLTSGSNVGICGNSEFHCCYCCSLKVCPLKRYRGVYI